MINGHRVLDAHQHVWRLAEGHYSWLTPEAGSLHDTFEFDQAEPLAEQCGVDDVILVQADDTAHDTAYMLETASKWARVAGVVAWAPLTDHDALDQTLEGFKDDDRIVGIRHLIHTEADEDWLLRDDVQTGLGRLEASGLSFDVVAVTPRHLEHVATLGRRFPDLRLVIDHLAKPPILAGEWEPWASLLANAASFPNVTAKVSGLDTAASPNYDAAELRRYLDHALEVFGAGRLMFGSDWPVSTLAGGYERWWTVLGELIAPLSDQEQAAILGGSARAAYGMAE